MTTINTITLIIEVVERKMRRNIKKMIPFVLILVFALLPFLSATCLVGFDTFLDSFENPQHYFKIENNDEMLGVNSGNEEFIIIQKSSHPDFDITPSDSVIYSNYDGDIECNEIHHVNSISTFNIYYTSQENKDPIYENQIIGKIVNNIDNNIWNSLSLKLWEISIYNLNIRVLEK